MIYLLVQLLCRHPRNRQMVLHTEQKILCDKCGKTWLIAPELCNTSGIGLVLKDREYAAKGKVVTKSYERKIG